MSREVAVRQSTLDFLRGLAAVYVLCNHARGTFYIGGQKLLAEGGSLTDYLTIAILQLTSMGVEFVILFFVLSGFAMRHSIANTSRAGKFYLRRFIRIYPPYVAAILVALVIGSWSGNPTVRDNFWQLLVYRGNSDLTPQFWSLVFEVIFYALCPLLLASTKSVRTTFFFAGVATLVSIIFADVRLNPWPSVWANFFGNELLFFAAGAMAYDQLDRIPNMDGRRLAVVSAILFASAYVAKFLIGESNAVSNLVMVGWTVILIRNIPQRLTEVRWLNLGSFSYSIYLYHYALLFAGAAWLRTQGIEPSAITNPFAWLIAVPTVLALSYLLYRMVEKPCNDLIAKMRQPKTAVSHIAIS